LQQKIKDARLAQIKTQLQALVDKGVITQSQADKRLATVQAKKANVKGYKMGKRHGHGMDMGW
jgi:ribosomal protein L19E